MVNCGMAGELCMTAVWLAPLALTIALQLVTAGASIGRVSTSKYIVSRGCNALTLGAVTADFAVKYFWTRRVDDLAMQLVFGSGINIPIVIIYLKNSTVSGRKPFLMQSPSPATR